MSTVVDQRVVEMGFDNRQFERNVSTTMSTLEKLKQSLSFSGAAKGFEGINTAARSVNISGLGSAVETIQAKFSALEVMGVTALANITNSAVNAGKRIVSALTIDPVKTGFDEYETKINAIQTIMSNTASKGTTMDDVTRVIGELNTYADKTIYNFAEMTRNIGTFTAAGVGLEESASAIQGIANLAAASGSTSQQASTAMYQLSQALAAGTVKLMDWNSVVNAGMGGEKFQEALKATARDHGIAVDALIKKNGSFRESLQEGWITADILNETLNKFTVKGATEYSKAMIESGKWTQEQADALLKEAQAMEDAATKVKTFTQLWDTLKESAQSGWSQSWEIIVGDFEEAKAFFTEISDVMGGLIGDSADARNKVLEGWKDLGGRTAMIDALRNAFEGVMSILKPVNEAFREIFPPITAKQLYDFSVGLKELTEKFKLSEEASEKVKSAFKGIFSVFGIGLDALVAVGKGATTLVKNIVGLDMGLLDIAAASGEWLTNLRESIKETDLFGRVIEKITGFVETAISKIKEFGSSIGKSFKAPEPGSFTGTLVAIWTLVSDIGSKIVSVFSALGTGLADALGETSIFNAINSGLFAGILAGIAKFVWGLSNPFKEARGFLSNITDILDDVRGCFEAYQNQLKAGTLVKIATAIGVLAASIWVISSINPEALDRAIGALTILFAELLGSLSIFSKISTDMTGVLKSCMAMISMSLAVSILAGALKKLASVDADDIGKGLVAIGALLAELSIFLATAKFDSKITGTAVGMVVLSSAMLIMAQAVKSFGNIDTSTLTQGMVSIGILLGELALFSRLTGNAEHVFATGAAMVMLGGAMKIFVSVIQDLGSMDTNVIGKGLIALGLGLAELVVALRLMNGTLAGSAALVIASAALALMVPVLKSLGGMTWEEIARGLVALAGGFAVVGIAGLLLAPLVPTILGLAGAFALFGVAVFGIGAGMALVGIGLTAIAAGFTALATAGAAGATAIVASLTVIVMGIANLIPAIAEKLGEAIVAFSVVIGECAPVLADSILTLIVEVLRSCEEHLPTIAESLLQLFIGVINAVADNMPDLIKAGVELIMSFFQGVTEALKGIDTNALLQGILAVGLLSGLMIVLSAVAGLVPGAMLGVLGMGVVIAELALVLAAIGALAQIPGLEWLISEGGEFLGKIGTAIGQFAGGIVGGFMGGVSSSFPKIGEDLAQFMTNAKPFIDGAKSIDESALKGVKALAETILILTAADILSGIASWITGGSSLADFGKDLAPFGESMKAYSRSVAGIDAAAVTASATAAKALSELADNLPNEGGVISWFTGDNSLVDFAEKLLPFGVSLKAYSLAVIGINAAAITESAAATKALGEVADSLPNKGGVFSWFTGDNDIAEFARDLIPFGKDLKEYSDTVAGVNSIAILSSSSAIRSLVGIINSLTDIDTSGVQSFKTAINSLATTSIEGFVNAFKTSDTKLKQIGTGLVESFSSGIKSRQSALTTAINSLMSSMLNAIRSNVAVFQAEGAVIIAKFAAGISSGRSNVTTSIATAMSQTVAHARSYYTAFYNAGRYLVTGFADGISSNTWAAEARARAMASAAINAAKNELDEHSPSRVGFEIGDFFSIAFVNGIGNNIKKAYSVSSDMANSARKGLTTTVSKIRDILDSDVDMNPTIRPVLDLSEIRSGAGAIDGMLGVGSSVRVLTNVGKISGMMNQRGQNGVNADVVSAINKLRGDLGKVGNTYNSINGITYDDGSNVSDAVKVLVRAARIERRV